jgi:ABC-type transporter Mla maintaining outer membrane lipid asymmetry ATPase subunit MlaF/ABC-type transporter Mla maintaining outer membrane lipid asymmetry permease subunit MlaE
MTSPDAEHPQPLILAGVTVTIGERVILDDVSLTIPADKITVIVGGSGAGKSVLLRILSGLIERDSEPIQWQGAIDHGEGKPLGRVGIVFQHFALFDELSATANVQFAVDHRRRTSVVPEQSAAAWLQELRVPTNVPVAALSGGQKQRLAIARTLAGDPEVVLYDEPTSGLDAASGRQVAELIRRTQQKHRRTSVVVTHDYETLLPIADHVLLLDTAVKKLVIVPREEWAEIPTRMQPVPQLTQHSSAAAEVSSGPVAAASTKSVIHKAAVCNRFLVGAWLALKVALNVTGHSLFAFFRLPWELLPLWRHPVWGLRFWGHYLRLICGPSAWLYLLMSGAIIGFTSTYFTFKFLPFQLYTKPLLLEDLLASIGFALYRVLVPVLATILIAARCGAAIAADVGVKRYGHQIEAMQTLSVPARSYLLNPILLAFALGTPLLTWLAFIAAKWVSLVCFVATHPDQGAYFWEVHFSYRLRQESHFFYTGTGWFLLKTICCGLGVGLISYYRGARHKQSTGDVSYGITSTVLWATLYVLVVHFLVALYEF